MDLFCIFEKYLIYSCLVYVSDKSDLGGLVNTFFYIVQLKVQGAVHKGRPHKIAKN